MATINDYHFNNIGRIGFDTVNVSQRNIQNQNHSNWLLTNFHTGDCMMNQTKQFALSAPMINYTGSYGLGLNGCNVDASSELKLDNISRPPCRISLFQRPYLTVPYLGRGAVNSDEELRLLTGDLNSSRKTITDFSEMTVQDRHFIPMLKTTKDTVGNCENCVESKANSNWIRGGMPSREYTKYQLNK